LIFNIHSSTSLIFCKSTNFYPKRVPLEMHVSAAWSEVDSKVELLIEKPRAERSSFSVKLRICYRLRRPEWGYWGKLGIRNGNNRDWG